MLFFEQANRGLEKSSGRTGDRVTIPSISDKALPAYFRKDAGLGKWFKGNPTLSKTQPLSSTLKYRWSMANPGVLDGS